MSNEIANITNSENMLVSFQAETVEDKKALYNAINSPDFRIADMINKPIKIRDALIMTVALSDDDTGEIREMPRSILIDTEGKTYTAVSSGIASSLRNIFSVFGTLHFDDGLEMTVKQVQTKKGSTLNLVF